MKMSIMLQINKTYKLKFLFNGRYITYTATILNINNVFVNIRDKFGNIYNYNITNLESFEEMENLK